MQHVKRGEGEGSGGERGWRGNRKVKKGQEREQKSEEEGGSRTVNEEGARRGAGEREQKEVKSKERERDQQGED